jgi:anti-anti-sigma factor
MTTADRLRRELELLEPVDHRTLTVDLSGCEFLDTEGILTLLESFKRCSQAGRSLAVVTGTGSVARLLHVVGFDHVVPTFPTEEAAVLAVRGGGPPLPAPATGEAARADTLARWRLIEKVVDQDSPLEAVRLLTSMTALCERSEELYQERSAPATARCQFCPLFYALGGRAGDVGCQSILDPILQAVRSDNRDWARANIGGDPHHRGDAGAAGRKAPGTVAVLPGEFCCRSERAARAMERRKTMETRRSSDLFAALVTAGLLLLAAWGNALALLVAAAAALIFGWVFFRPRNPGVVLVAALARAAIAAIIVAVVHRLR